MDLPQKTVQELIEMRFSLELEEAIAWGKTLRKIESWRQFNAIVPSRKRFKKSIERRLSEMTTKELRQFINHYKAVAQQDPIDKDEILSLLTYATLKLVRISA